MTPPPLILDISRLLSRVLHATPTGVDRVEMAYARGFLATARDRLQFAAVHPVGLYGRLPEQAVLRFLDETERRWEMDSHIAPWALRRFAADTLQALRPRSVAPRHDVPSPVYVQSSPHHLTKPTLVRNILRRERARFVCLVHDLIPLQFPEYARPNGAVLHAARIRTIAEHASGIIANSHATLEALRPWIRTDIDRPHLAVAHLGTHDGTPLADHDTGSAGKRPYFVCVATIEPRKNHLLLLNLWRRMSEQRGANAVPRLILIGRRGWENEQIVDMLDRCPALVGCVEERNGLSDRQTRTVIANAAALLLPSFAEGYGMPVTEALDLGTPVLCSDLPALREAGGNAPVFLDPLDGPAWQRAIDTFTATDAPDRIAALRRMATWQRPDWKSHIDIVSDLVNRVAE